MLRILSEYNRVSIINNSYRASYFKTTGGFHIRYSKGNNKKRVYRATINIEDSNEIKNLHLLLVSGLLINNAAH